jgi:hypothetical protein
MQKIRLNYFFNEMMLKLTSFSMSKLIMPYFQPLLTLPLSIGHEKHPFGYVMDFENDIVIHVVNLFRLWLTIIMKVFHTSTSYFHKD